MKVSYEKRETKSSIYYSETCQLQSHIKQNSSQVHNEET